MLTPSAPPELLLELTRLLETDYAVPDLWDPDKQVLLDNDAYLYNRVNALTTGEGLDAGVITDAHLGARGILDTHAPPPSAAYDDTLTNHLRTLATRVKAIMGTASWADGVPTTLAVASAHVAATTAHSATSAATADRIIVRDAHGRARVSAPEHPDDIARKADIDLAAAGEHDHDDRYYTQTQLGASGGTGTNIVHADRIGAGTLAGARIPNLNASKITAGTLADARIPNLNASKITAGTLAVARGGTGLGSITGLNFIRGNNAGGFVERTPAQVLADIGGISGSHTHSWWDITSKPTSFTPSAHTHGAGDITSGTLGLARIPTIPPAQTTFMPTFGPTAQVYTVSTTANGSVLRGVSGWSILVNQNPFYVRITHNFGTTNYSVFVMNRSEGATIYAVTSLTTTRVQVYGYNSSGGVLTHYNPTDILVLRW